jgi:copper oxidase (laccase) domain-containing protein
MYWLCCTQAGRSTKERISSRAVEKMAADFACQVSDMIAVIGPGISRANYQVDKPVISSFQENNFEPDRIFTDRTDSNAWLGLELAVSSSLLEAGLGEDQIFSAHLCTHTLRSLFFSHRRDGLPGGRMMAVARIVL